MLSKNSLKLIFHSPIIDFKHGNVPYQSTYVG
jgi:hypothetical protein